MFGAGATAVFGEMIRLSHGNQWGCLQENRDVAGKVSTYNWLVIAIHRN
jgi:hypothetical protein